MTLKTHSIIPLVITALLALFAAFGPGKDALAHEVPTDVVVQTIIRPAGNSLDLLVRVPLEAMRDVNFPQTGPGYLVISEADQFLRDAATIWIAQEIGVYENDNLLENWRIEATRLALPSDSSFESYDRAIENLRSPPLADSEDLVGSAAPHAVQKGIRARAHRGPGHAIARRSRARGGLRRRGPRRGPA